MLDLVSEIQGPKSGILCEKMSRFQSFDILQVGQPVLRVREGRLQDGVVLEVLEPGGLRILCAIAVGSRLAGSTSSGGRASAAAYQ